MRSSRIFSGLVIIALVAVGLIYLDQHGMLQNPKVTPMGVMNSDETTPKVSSDRNSPDAAPTSVPPKPANSPDPMATGTAVATANVPPPETNPAAEITGDDKAAGGADRPTVIDNHMVHETATVDGQPAAQTANQPMLVTPTAPPETKIRYVDSQGKACRPVQVQVKPATVHVHHRKPVDNWTWRPASGPHMNTPCGLLHQTASGQRVVNLQPGMVINVASNQALSTETTAAGQDFTGYLIGPITYCGEVIVPAGAAVQGSVVHTRRHTFLQEDDSVLQLKLTAMDANGYRIPLSAYSYNRRTPTDVPYKTTHYMNDPNWVETSHTTNHDITLPANSVVSFWLQNSVEVYF